MTVPRRVPVVLEICPHARTGMKIAKIAARERVATVHEDMIAPQQRVDSRTLKQGGANSDAKRNYRWGVCRNDEFGNGVGHCMTNVYQMERLGLADQHYRRQR